ncbi:AIPR family protein [Bacillus cereus]|uniref:AIPR family protein n=1 Tax=Bacillus cereus TaxID=1396 RepID=UPI00084C52AD|nr:AIPR family protein [Bacillus cereus]OED05093.1 hypothetical protein A9756_08490 [Bacillus cereus]
MSDVVRYSLQDFSLVSSIVENINQENNMNSSSNAFYFFVMDCLFNLQDDETEECITDNFYLRSNKKESGHDRGIDIIYLDDSDTKAHVHLFNFKYTNIFDNTKKNFPSGEIEKILNYINLLLQQEESLLEHVNPSLKNKTEEIWEVFKSQNPEITIHLCSNHYHGLESREKRRLELELGKYSNINVVEHTLTEWVKLITKSGKKNINAKLRVIDKNYFEKSVGDIRALIAHFDAKDLIRMIVNDDDVREKADFEDFEQLVNYDILEDAFEDNVRVYLKQRTKINRNIKETALSDESHRFFYYNNGITITCDKFSYPSRRAPIVELENLQIVNGSQTLHALFDAFKESPDCLEDIDLLVRIYETKNDQLTTRIAEYTNSQNPVKSRDIRAIDYMQVKLESELFSMGYYYERKKNQYGTRPKKDRIDAEKAGQVLMAFYNEMPSEAKNKKSIIFSEKYDEVFNERINASRLLLPYLLYNKIENEKNEWKNANVLSKLPEKSYIPYATYYILYIFSKVMSLEEIINEVDSVERIWCFYPFALEVIEKVIEKEKSFQVKDDISLVSLFKQGRTKKHIEDIIDTGEFELLLKRYKEYLKK